MKTWYITKDETEYECPYCHIEIEDWTGEEQETRTEYCGKCMNEFKIEVI